MGDPGIRAGGSEPAGERWPRLALALALALLASLAIYNDFHRSLWMDEAYTLNTVRRSLAGTFHQSVRFELQPPLYFLLLNVWLRVSPTIEWARLFSTLVLALVLWMLHRLAKLLEIERSPLSLPLAAALCPMLLWAASEARCYALAILLTTCATFYYLRVWGLSATGSRRDVLLYVAFAYLALLTHYYVAFVLAAQLVAGLFFTGRRRALLLSFLALGLLLLPWVPTILGQTSTHPNYESSLTFSTTLSLAGWVLSTLRQTVFDTVSVVARPGAALILALLLVALVGLRLRRGTAPWSRAETAVTLMATVPFAALVCLRLGHLALVENRHYVMVTTWPIVLAALLVARTERRWSRVALGSLLTAAFAVSAISYQRNSADGPEGWKGAAAYVARSAAVSEPILFADPYGMLPFEYYYHGPNALRGLPRDPPLDSYALSSVTIGDEGQLRERFTAVVRPSDGFWLIERLGLYYTLGGAILDRFVRSDATVVEMRQFGGVRVIHARYVPPPG